MKDEYETLRTAAWASFATWAIKEPLFIDQFYQETGIQLAPAPVSPLDALIDKVCGKIEVKTSPEEAALMFLEWLTRTHWGVEEAPEEYKRTLNAEKSPAPRG